MAEPKTCPLCRRKIRDIALAPTVEESIGRWIGIANGYADGNPVYDEWECSNCGYIYEDDEPPKWNYCPKCGQRKESE